MIDQNTTNAASSAPRLLRLPDVRRITGLSRSTIYAMIQANAFPAQRNVTSNLVAWSAEEVHAWVDGVLHSSPATKAA